MTKGESARIKLFNLNILIIYTYVLCIYFENEQYIYIIIKNLLFVIYTQCVPKVTELLINLIL